LLHREIGQQIPVEHLPDDPGVGGVFRLALWTGHLGTARLFLALVSPTCSAVFVPMWSANLIGASVPTILKKSSAVDWFGTDRPKTGASAIIDLDLM
jgi:hypothetical protein